MIFRRALPVPAWMGLWLVLHAGWAPVPPEQEDPSAPDIVRRGFPGAPGTVVLRGPTELRDLGRALVSERGAWAPFPGIGTLPETGVDSLELWITSDLAALPEGLRHPEPWVAGVADPAGRRIALRTGPGLAGPSGLRSVLRHELAHVALAAATNGNYSRWLTEGYAQYVSGEWSLGDAWHLQYAFLRRGAATLRDIDLRFRRHTADVRMGYLLSYTAVHELAALGGEAGLRAVFGHLREGSTFGDAVASTYGITEEAFEKRWKRSLVDRYGWLYLLSRAGAFWLGVTVLVLFVSLRRSRRDRERLEALREEELAASGGPEAATHERPPGDARDPGFRLN